MKKLEHIAMIIAILILLTIVIATVCSCRSSYPAYTKQKGMVLIITNQNK